MTAPPARIGPIVLLLAALAFIGCKADRDRPRATGSTTTLPVAAEPLPVAAEALPAPLACYTGPDGTAGVGVCHGGVQTFPDGPCLGEVVPSPEVCNGRDDDCNGITDDGLGTITCGVGACEATAPACAAGKPGTCTPGTPRAEVCDGLDNDCDGVVDEDCPCVHVAPSGDDAAPGTAQRPMRSIGGGIRRATERGQPRRVCVAAGSSCPASFDYPEAVAMVNGISVFGGYEASGTSWARKGCVTRILAQDARGVVFDESIDRPTSLDGFTIVGADQTENAAVSIAGSTGAVVSNDIVQGGGGEVSRGVHVYMAERPATPRIVRNTITGGRGTVLAIGILSQQAAPVIQGNCSAIDAAGRCVAGGCEGWIGFIRGHERGGIGQESAGVRLEDSPGAVVAQNAICADAAITQAVGVRVFGNATGTVIRANHVLAIDAKVATGVLIDECDGTSPWLFDNTRLGARSQRLPGRTAGVYVVGDCHPRLDSNQLVVGNEGGNTLTDGIFCGRDPDEVPSRCIIEGNASITGSLVGVPSRSTGIRCEGSCIRIARNGHISGRGGASTIGVSLSGDDTLVDANLIEGGCGSSGAVGLEAHDSSARVQNNLIIGGICPPVAQPTSVVQGIHVRTNPGTAEMDIHSNTVLAVGAQWSCTGRALVYDVLQAMTGPSRRGLVRNNVLDGGACERSLAVEENVGAGPRVLANNDLWRAATAPVGLYQADGTRDLRTIAEIESIPGLEAHGNIAAAPEGGGPQGGISATSPCRNAGTDDGAPAWDLLGHARPAEGRYDIGAYEFTP